MSHNSDAEFYQYLPQNVKRIIAHGGGCWIGEVDQTTVLKYPHFPDQMQCVQIEAKMLNVLGHHPRIVQSKGFTEHSLLLEFVPNGNVCDYLLAHPETSLERRLAWCVQATEAVAHMHSKRILHCDIRHDNLLLDANLDLKLADFQGQHFFATGEVLLDALSVESTKSYLPRKPGDHARIKTDLFALGSTIYFVIMGHELYPDLDGSKDDEEIERRFRDEEFPRDAQICAAVTAKCWRQLYSSAQQVLTDLEKVQAAFNQGETPGAIVRDVVPVPSEDVQPEATWWLSGLCDNAQELKEPPPYRQLTGFD